MKFLACIWCCAQFYLGIWIRGSVNHVRNCLFDRMKQHPLRIGRSNLVDQLRGSDLGWVIINNRFCSDEDSLNQAEMRVPGETALESPLLLSFSKKWIEKSRAGLKTQLKLGEAFSLQKNKAKIWLFQTTESGLQFESAWRRYCGATPSRESNCSCSLRRSFAWWFKYLDSSIARGEPIEFPLTGRYCWLDRKSSVDEERARNIFFTIPAELGRTVLRRWWQLIQPHSVLQFDVEFWSRLFKLFLNTKKRSGSK